jgi:hypothetical protein
MTDVILVINAGFSSIKLAGYAGTVATEADLNRTGTGQRASR